MSTSVYWQKIRDQEVTNLSSHLSNTYQLEGIDVGETLVANVNSDTDGYRGVARVVFPPVQIDPLLKMNLFQSLNANFLQFDVKLKNRAGKLSLNSESVTLVDF